MKIKILDDNQNFVPPKDTFFIEMSTYWGDADGYSQCNFLVSNQDIKKVIYEIEMVKAQFEYGRGGSDMYDQRSYFLGRDHYFNWLEKVHCSDDGHNDTIDGVKIFYFDSNGDKKTVEVEELGEFLQKFKQLNKQFKIGDYDVWNGSYDSKVNLYDNYREAVVALLETALINEEKIELSPKKPKLL